MSNFTQTVIIVGVIAIWIYLDKISKNIELITQQCIGIQ